MSIRQRAKRYLTPQKKRELLRILNIDEAKKRISHLTKADSPFMCGTILATLFDMGLQRTTIAELRKFCEKQECSFYHNMKKIRRGFAAGHVWDYHETESGKVWIDNWQTVTENTKVVLQRHS